MGVSFLFVDLTSNANRNEPSRIHGAMFAAVLAAVAAGGGCPAPAGG